MTGIEWTDQTWNPVTGCSKVSPGCAHCYAETISLRFGWSKLPWTPANAAANVVLHPERLAKPLSWREPRMVFVNSMSDLFHEQVPDAFIAEVYAVMEACPRHTFQVLTKRPERAYAVLQGRPATPAEVDDGYELGYVPGILYDREPPPNVWVGVSIENARYTWRARTLAGVPAAVRFISAEPLLGSLFKQASWPGRVDQHAIPTRPLDLAGIDWLIAGGESGVGHRPMEGDWVRELRDNCRRASVAFFFKQWGGPTPKSGGRILDGVEHSSYPAVRA